MSLQVGAQGKATARFDAPLQDGSNVVWQSSDPTIAKVTGDPFSAGNQINTATVGGLAAGTCNITCTVTNPDGSTAAGNASETVVAPAPDVTSVTVTVP